MYPIITWMTWKALAQLDKKWRILFSIFSIIVLTVIFRQLKFMGLHTANDINIWNNNFRCMTLMRLDSIAIGAFAAWCKNFYSTIWLKNKWFTFFIGIFLMIVFDRTWILNGHLALNQFSYVFYFLVYPLAVSLIFPVLNSWKLKKEFFLTQAITQISIISYSIYLFHNSLIRIPIQLSFLAKNYPILTYLVYWLIVFIVAVASYRLVEKPFLKYRNRNFPN